jgi:2-polyprenyl-6-methoxyphenol hydroxylase-like FAD-dependent oxidoreductase
MTVVIAGGGIAGLATAHALRAAGLGSRILLVEPLTTARKPPRVVALWSNTLAALDKLGLKSQVCPLRTQPEIVGGAKYMAGAGYRWF